MAGKVYNAEGDDITRWVAGKMRLLKRLPHLIEEEGIDQQMVATIKDIIATSATERTRRVEGRIGRIVSHDMIDLVNSRISSEGEDHATYLIGWNPADFADKRTPTYPVIQDQGDPHPNPNPDAPDAERIPGMHALQTTRDEFIPIIRAAMRAKLRGRNGE